MSAKSAKRAWTKKLPAKIGDVFKPSKFGNVKVVTNGDKFDSKRESKKYQELVLRRNAGDITALELKPKYELIPSKRRADGTLERACAYIADWRFIDSEGALHVQDAKGFRTDSYIIKRKLMFMIHNIEVEEV